MSKIKLLLPFFFRDAKTQAALIAAGALISFLDLTFVLRAKHFLDAGAWLHEVKFFFREAMLLLGIFLSAEGLRFWAHYASDQLTRRFALRLQDALVARVAAAPLATFVGQRRGDLMARVMKDADALSLFSVSFLASLLRDPLRALFFLGLLLASSPVFGALVVVGASAVGWITRRYRSSAEEMFAAMRHLDGTLFQWMETLLEHFPFLKAHSATGWLYAQWCQANERVWQRQMQANRMFLRYRLYTLLFFVALMAFLFVAALQNWGLFSNTPGTVAMLAASTFFCFSGLRQTALHWAGGIEEWGRACKIAEILSWKPETQTPPVAVCFPQDGGLRAVRLENVAFSYESGKPVLRCVNWVLRRGMAAALAGPNGSGKTTLAYLLLRLFEPQGGAIYYNDSHAREWDLQELRRRVGLVFQEPCLIDGTLRENLLAPAADAPFEKQQEAFGLVGLGALARDPATLDEFQIGPKKMGLSYGERQRLGLARVLLLDPDLLILDEATSALDPDSERDILRKLLERRRDKITVVISHRSRELGLPLEPFYLKDGEILSGAS